MSLLLVVAMPGLQQANKISGKTNFHIVLGTRDI